MNSPKLAAVWQGSAQADARVLAAFAMGKTARHCFRAGQGQSCRDLRSLRCYPSPSLRSGPSQAGPILVGGVALNPRGDGEGGVKIRFEMRDIAVESAAITTNPRGSIPCASPLSSSLFLSPRSPGASRTLRPAALLVRRRALSSLTRPTATCLPVPSSAALPVLPPAASRLACRPVTRATDHHRLRAGHTTFRDHPGRAPGWSFSLRLMGEADV